MKQFLQRNKNLILWLLFLCYAFVMGRLLFDRPTIQGGDYWVQVQQNLNFEPLRTVQMYLRAFRTNQSPGRVNAIFNLGGNVVLFTPIGLFLPLLFPKLKKVWRFFSVVILSILLVELVQLFALVGRCDVDDLILNVFGAGLGFVTLFVFKKIRK